MWTNLDFYYRQYIDKLTNSLHFGLWWHKNESLVIEIPYSLIGQGVRKWLLFNTNCIYHGENKLIFNVLDEHVEMDFYSASSLKPVLWHTNLFIAVARPGTILPVIREITLIKRVSKHIMTWHLLGHAIKSVTCFDLQFWRSTRPMTSFCIFTAFINTEGILFNVKITRWD